MDLQQLKQDVTALTEELVKEAKLEAGDLFVLGLSTSEVKGEHIGKASSPEIGETIVHAIYDVLKPLDIDFAVQGCEHINRALTMETAAAKRHGCNRVTVKPAYDAGGAGSVAAWNMFDEPTCVEYIIADAGLDIGDTAIGMHIRHVQVPVRLQLKELGGAHVTALRTRPKLIGGARAQYP